MNTLGLVLILSLISPIAKGADLEASIRKILQAEGMSNATTGIYISGPEGEAIFGQNEKKTFISASVMKIVTAMTALEEFGPSYAFSTQVFLDSAPVNKTVKGNIYLKGGGDPSLVSEKMWMLVNDLTRENIKTIEGNLIVDDTLYDRVRWHEGRLPHREERAFDAPVGALSFNWNSANVFVRPGKSIGDAGQVVIDPENNYVKLVNKTTTVKGDDNKTNVTMVRNKAGDQVMVSGSIGVRAPETVVYRSISEPDLFAGHNFIQFLAQRGIVVKGEVKRGEVPTSAILIKEAQGSPMRKIVEDMMKFSNNYVAEMLVKALAASRGQKTATLDRGIEIQNEFMKLWGVPKEEYQLKNPAGLSRQNLLSPRALTIVLDRAKTKFPIAPEFMASFPIGGVDGTLRRRMKADSSKGMIRAKTGMLDDVVSLSGYIERADNKLLTFAMIYNGSKDRTQVQQAFDRIGSLLINGSK